MPEPLWELATAALIKEVGATPKPGLVDRNNTGAHRDMDHGLFVASARALEPHFAAFAKIGGDTGTLAPETAFETALRPAGVLAEQAMLAATSGVNTHKGAIFSLGLLLAAAARNLALELPLTPDVVSTTAAGFVSGICARELKSGVKKPVTKGERAYLEYGVKGVRFEAESGFPTVLFVTLPGYRRLLSQGADENAALCGALIQTVAVVADTNVITRLDAKAGDYARQAAKACWELLQKLPVGSPSWYGEILKLDADFIQRGISPGGCADLLACAWFLSSLDFATA